MIDVDRDLEILLTEGNEVNASQIIKNAGDAFDS